MRNKDFYKQSRTVCCNESSENSRDSRKQFKAIRKYKVPTIHTSTETGQNVHIGLSIVQVTVVKTEKDLLDAMKSINARNVIGFDTESKPTYIKGEVSLGPHLMQLATPTRAYLFSIPSHVSSSTPFELLVQSHLQQIIQSDKIMKVGFGLASDKIELKRKFGIEIRNVVDLSYVLRVGDERDCIGTQRGVLRVLGTHFIKSKRLSRSNWNMNIDHYSKQMILYAANDAHVALLVYIEWLRKKPANE